MVPLSALLILALADAASGFLDAAPGCDDATRYCFGLELHMVVDEGKTAQTPKWVADELAHANELFEPIDVGFELADVELIDSKWHHLVTRLDRDHIGRAHDRDRGVIHVFVVETLDDVDIEGNTLYGVHWRDRADVSQRWIILSAKDTSSTALAHEMGHYFGLPHSRYDVSIMNKRPRETPSWPERVFAPLELKRMHRRRNAMVRTGFLQPRTDQEPSDQRPM